MSGTDHHQTAAAVLAALRGEPAGRPQVDPALAGGLREWLEDELAPLAAGLPAGAAPTVLDRRVVAGVPIRQRPGGEPGLQLAKVQSTLARTLFRQLVTTGRIGHPLEDALAGLAATGRGDATATFLSTLSVAERSRLRRELSDRAAGMVRHWPALVPTWLPRTGEHLMIPFAGGRITLSGTIDLLVGTPSQGQASVCLVELATAAGRSDQWPGVRFLALLETLRSGAAPARTAVFDPVTGEVAAEEVTEEALCATVASVVREATQPARAAVPFESGPHPEQRRAA
jgi:hypothetical protein